MKSSRVRKEDTSVIVSGRILARLDSWTHLSLRPDLCSHNLSHFNGLRDYLLLPTNCSLCGTVMVFTKPSISPPPFCPRCQGGCGGTVSTSWEIQIFSTQHFFSGLNIWKVMKYGSGGDDQVITLHIISLLQFN